jgi:putative DNA primase/helicase
MLIQDSSVEKNIDQDPFEISRHQLGDLKKLAGIGFHIFPINGFTDGKCQCNKACAHEGKHPITHNGMNAATCDVEQIEKWFNQYPNCNWAINCMLSGLVCIDVDPRSGGDNSLARIEGLLEDSLPVTVRVLTGLSRNLEGSYVRGGHIYFKDDGRKWPSNLSKFGFPGIDIKSNGYVLIPNSRHKSGHSYEWADGLDPLSVEVAEIPQGLIDLVFPRKSKSSNSVKLKGNTSYQDLLQIQKPPIDLLEFFGTDLPEGSRATEIFSAACSMARREGVDEHSRNRIVTKFRDFNQMRCNPPLDEEELESHVRNAIEWVASEIEKETFSIVVSDGDGIIKTEPLKFHFTENTTESELAEWLGSKVFEGNLAWSQNKKWLRYMNGYWQQLPTEFVVEMVRLVLKEVVLDLHQEHGVSSALKRSMSFETNKKCNDVVALMKGICGVGDDVFDSHHDLLNAKNGVVDLRTGELLKHSSEYFFTRITPANFVSNAVHDDWEAALKCLPPSVAAYMQIRLGQAITGNIPDDDKNTFAIGGGENGKTTFITGLKSALGSYLTFVPSKVLMGNKSDHPTEIMTLLGARLAVIEELPEGSELPIAQLKRITGVKSLIARGIGQNNQEFVCTHSLLVTTNTLPTVSAFDHGTWRKLEVIEFPYRFSVDVKEDSDFVKRGDPMLRNRLSSNESGQSEAVLAWLVCGAVEHAKLEGKLPKPPKEVTQSTGNWRKQNDYVFRFISENLVLDPDSYIRSSELYSEFRKVIGGLHADNAIAQKIKSHGYLSSKGVYSTRKPILGDLGSERVTVWVGVRLKD